MFSTSLESTDVETVTPVPDPELIPTCEPVTVPGGRVAAAAGVVSVNDAEDTDPVDHPVCLAPVQPSNATVTVVLALGSAV